MFPITTCLVLLSSLCRWETETQTSRSHKPDTILGNPMFFYLWPSTGRHPLSHSSGLMSPSCVPLVRTCWFPQFPRLHPDSVSLSLCHPEPKHPFLEMAQSHLPPSPCMCFCWSQAWRLVPEMDLWFRAPPRGHISLATALGSRMGMGSSQSQWDQ